MKNVKLEGVTRGDKLCKSRGGEKFWGDTGEDIFRAGIVFEIT